MREINQNNFEWQKPLTGRLHTVRWRRSSAIVQKIKLAYAELKSHGIWWGMQLLPHVQTRACYSAFQRRPPPERTAQTLYDRIDRYLMCFTVVAKSTIRYFHMCLAHFFAIAQRIHIAQFSWGFCYTVYYFQQFLCCLFGFGCGFGAQLPLLLVAATFWQAYSLHWHLRTTK